MPDDSNNNQNQTQNPTPTQDSGNQTTQTTNPPSVVPDFQSTAQQDVPPIPKQPEEVNQNQDTQPNNNEGMSQGSAAPSDFPDTTPAPKKKFGRGKVIATILGLLLLVGGVGAGVFVTQTNQDIRERAASDVGYRHEQKCTKSGESSRWCWNYSDPICEADPGHPVACSEVQSGWEASGFTCTGVTEPCGGQGGGGGGGGDYTPQCPGPVVAFDADWNMLSAEQLSLLQAGDVVRFGVANSMTLPVAGDIKLEGARFTINGSQNSEVSAADPSGKYFYQEYTITESDISSGTFSVSAQVKYLTKWF